MPQLAGDIMEQALEMIGISQERVSRWIGKPCGCQERKEKLNQLHRWAIRVVTGRTKQAKEFLEQILNG